MILNNLNNFMSIKMTKYRREVLIGELIFPSQNEQTSFICINQQEF